MCVCVLCFGQGHFQHGPQLAAGPNPQRPEMADRRVHPPAKGTSSGATLQQTPDGAAHVSLALLRLPKRAAEQVCKQ